MILRKSKTCARLSCFSLYVGTWEDKKNMNGLPGEIKALLLRAWLLRFRTNFHSANDWTFSRLLSEASVRLGPLYIQEVLLSWGLTLELCLSSAAALPGPLHLLSSPEYWSWSADWNYCLDPGHVLSLWICLAIPGLVDVPNCSHRAYLLSLTICGWTVGLTVPSLSLPCLVGILST